MALVETSASTYLDVLDAIANFAASQAFTLNWNVVSDNGQVGLSIPLENFYLAFGCRTDFTNIPRNMLFSGGTENDLTFYAGLSTGFSATQRYNGNHPGSLIGTEIASTNASISNDWAGAFPSLRLFSNPAGDYVHVVAQKGSRFNHFSFGMLDNMGMSGDRVPYVTGLFYEFWEGNSDPAASNYNANKPSASGGSSLTATTLTPNIGHRFPFSIGHSGGSSTHLGTQENLYLPANVMDPTFFPETQGIISTRTARLVEIYNNADGNPSWSRFIGFMHGRMNALSTTIGRPLVDLPCFKLAGTNFDAPFQFMGRYPDVRLVWLDGLNPGQVIEVDNEQWMVFPWKQKGAEAAVASQGGVNTWDYGLAYRIHD